MKSWSASEWVKVYDTIHQELTVKGLKPKLQTLDNEASAALRNFFTANDVDYQLVPPHFHRRNADERAIRTFKEHFLAGLFSVDPTFPLHLWDRLLPKAEITLNLLQTSRLHPQLSTAAHFHGLVDYSKTAFSPPGCNIVAHKKIGKRRTWEPHGQHGYSLGPAMHHYRCQNVYVSAMASECIVDTLEFFPHNHPMPQLSSTDKLIVATKDMTDALQNPHPEVPFAHVIDDTISALADLASIFKLKLRQTSPPTLPAAIGQPTHMPYRIIQPYISFYHAPAASNEITDNNSHTRRHQRAITSEGGHTGHAQPITSEGAHSLAASRSPQPFTKRFLRNGHCPHGHCPSETTIGPSNTRRAQSSTPLPEKRRNTWHL
jgi:hypothetical protein